MFLKAFIWKSRVRCLPFQMKQTVWNLLPNFSTLRWKQTPPFTKTLSQCREIFSTQERKMTKTNLDKICCFTKHSWPDGEVQNFFHVTRIMLNRSLMRNVQSQFFFDFFFLNIYFSPPTTISFDLCKYFVLFEMNF